MSSFFKNYLINERAMSEWSKIPYNATLFEEVGYKDMFPQDVIDVLKVLNYKHDYIPNYINKNVNKLNES